MSKALISVTDKTGVVEFAKCLHKLGYEIVSTGNTYKIISEAGIKATYIDEVTKFPEMLDGRVKTLNPYIHGGILYKRDNEKHIETVKQYDIDAIDIVVVNLYDFEGAIKSNKSHENIIENIDIGGPTLIRSAAKNYKDVLIVVDPKDYNEVIERLSNKEVDISYREKLAYKAFSTTGRYDSLISNYFMEKVGEQYPDFLNLSFEKESNLRYGENPHQSASLYKESYPHSSQLEYTQLHGKELSFNNINDLSSTVDMINEFDEIVAVAVKHTNPCGAAIGKTTYEAFKKCYEADKTSIFGGIVGINSIIDKETAKLLNEIFLEIVIAPDFTEEALEILKSKKNIRLLKLNKRISNKKEYDFKYLNGKLLAQDKNTSDIGELKVVTNLSPSKEQIEDMKFGMKIAKHMKSNAIAIVKDKSTLALGPGQTSRIWALKNALENNNKDFNGATLVSDAFFPFEDCVELSSSYGINSIIQPGGSVNDKDSIEKCNEKNIAMVFTGIRNFKH